MSWLSQLLHSVPTTDSTNNVVIRDVVGSKADSASTTANSTTSLMRYIKGILAQVLGIFTYTSKIDNVAVDGLAGTVDSLAYKVHEIEKHFHSPGEVYGLTGGVLTRKSTAPIVVTSGDAVWGASLYLCGSVPETGVNTKYDLGKISVVAVGTANRPQVIEFYYGQIGAEKTGAVTSLANNTITLAGHGVIDGDRVVLNDIVTSTGINNSTVYYVRDMSGDSFKVELYPTAGAVDITGVGDGTCDFNPITGTTLMTEMVVSRAATSTDNIQYIVTAPRVLVTKALFCRGLSAAGGNTCSFFINMHKYSA